ncbi:MAG: hypothetical protein L0154_00050 [Chloroflexi bacterium]|nr:hypothetical protein [Chloroflexota bacterium]
MNKKSRTILGILSVLLFPLAFVFWYSAPDVCGSGSLNLLCLWMIFTGSALFISAAMAISNLISLLFRRNRRALVWTMYPMLVIAVSTYYSRELSVVREIHIYRTKHDEFETFFEQMPDPCEHRTWRYNFSSELRGVARDDKGYVYWHEDDDGTCSYYVTLDRTDLLWMSYFSNPHDEQIATCIYRLDPHWYVCSAQTDDLWSVIE